MGKTKQKPLSTKIWKWIGHTLVKPNDIIKAPLDGIHREPGKGTPQNMATDSAK
jgi:hypothetical protein